MGLCLSWDSRPCWRSPLSEGRAWLCPGEASRLCGQLQLCPGEPPSLRERRATWTALSRHQGITEGLASQQEGPCLELEVDHSAGPVGSTVAGWGLGSGHSTI